MPRQAAKANPIFFSLLVQANLPLPFTEWEFHHERNFRFDYFWPEADLAMEVDGGAWTGGRHTRGAGFLRDHEKRNAAACYGYRMIYTTPDDLCSQATLDLIREALLSGE